MITLQRLCPTVELFSKQEMPWTLWYMSVVTVSAHHIQDFHYKTELKHSCAYL